MKRKRTSGETRSTSPGLPSPVNLRKVSTSQGYQYQHDSSLVLVSKTFAKTTQLVLNEITSHKLAGIFAKPLSERDAPGYKDLVKRPQDLKSIRTAVSKGSRAAVAAIEALEAEGIGEVGEDGVEGEVGNGVWLVRKTDELVPPKGIVNVGQLECELVRMFANAVMFNPLPSAERGFGRSLRLRKYGGEVVVGESEEGTETGAEGEESESSESEGGEGIISDAREMFEETIQKIKEWRRVEGERMGGGGKEEAVRGSSIEVPESVEGDQVEGGERRKRRRVGE